MIKLMPLVEQIQQEQQLEEGWKENVMAAIIAASSLFGGDIKGQTVTDKPGIETVAQKPALNVDFGAVFPSGRYLIKGQDQDTLSLKLEQIGNYIVSNPNADFTIDIISSESQVPNYDAEKPGRVKLDTGELASKRAEIAKYSVTEFVNQLRKEGKVKGNVNIRIAPILIGKEKFTSGVDNKDDKKYTKDQFVRLVVKATSKTVDKYDIYADMGESVFMGNKLVGVVFYPTRKSADIKQAGVLDTRYQTVLLRMVKPDTPLTGKKNEKGVYTQDYIIPSNEWNKTVDPSNQITTSMLSAWEKFKVK